MTSTSSDVIDGVSTSANLKLVRGICTSNITLSGLSAISTVEGSMTPADGDRFLLTAQTSGYDNLIWEARSGAWTLAPDSDGSRDLRDGTMVKTQGGVIYHLTTADPIEPGTTSLTWARIDALSVTGQVQAAATIAALYALTGMVDGQLVKVASYYASATPDGGGGDFKYDSTSVATDNGGTVIKPTAVTGAGRWLRLYSGHVLADWFGAKGDGATDDTAAIAAAIATGVIGTTATVVEFSAGKTYLGAISITTGAGVNPDHGEKSLTILAAGATFKGRASDTKVINISPPIGAYANGIRIVGRPIIDMNLMADAATSIGLAMDHSYDNAISFAVINEPASGYGMSLTTGVYTTTFDDVHVGRALITGTSFGDAVTTLIFNNFAAKQVTASYAVDMLFNMPVLQGTLDKFALSNVSGLTVIGGDFEDTVSNSYCYNFGANCLNIVSINNNLAGGSIRYYTGTPYPAMLLDTAVSAQQLISLAKDLQFSTNSGQPRFGIGENGTLRITYNNTYTEPAINTCQLFMDNPVNMEMIRMADRFNNRRLAFRGSSGGFGITGAEHSTGNALNVEVRNLAPYTAAGAAQTAARIFAGSGAPSNADGQNGDYYLRSDGTQAGNTCIYHKEAGAWVGLVTT